MIDSQINNNVKLGFKASVDGLNKISEGEGVFSDGGKSPNGRDL